MQGTFVHNQPIELELASPTTNWVDRLRGGMWPKPFVFWAVVFYMGLFIIRPWEKLFPELGEMRFERLSVLGIMAVVAIYRGVLVRLTAQNLAMLFLFAAVVLSGKMAYDPELSDPQVTEFFGFTLIFFCIQKAVRSPYQVLFIVAAYVMLTTAYVGKSIWEYAFNGAAMYMMGVRRLAGVDFTYGHPNTVGTTLLCSLPFAISFYRIREQFCRTWPRRMSKLFRWVLLAHMSMSVIGVLMTKSRSAAVGLVVYACILAARQRGMARKMKWGVLFLIMFVIGFSMAPTEMQNRIRTLWDPTVEAQEDMGGAGKAAAGRWEGWVAGVAIFKKFPLTGVGIGNFADYRVEYIDYERLNAHNLPGELLGELGIVGTTAFAFYFLAYVLTLRKLQRQGQEFEQLTGDPLYRILSIGFVDGMLLLGFAGLSGHTLQQYQWYFYPSFAVSALYFVNQEIANAKRNHDHLSAEFVPGLTAEGFAR